MGRPDAKKELESNIKCTGHLFVEAAWTFPVSQIQAANSEDTIEDRVLKEKLRHTGRLQLKIRKAENVRIADIKRANGSDPYVHVYIRNEAFKSTEEDTR